MLVVWALYHADICMGNSQPNEDCFRGSIKHQVILRIDSIDRALFQMLPMTSQIIAYPILRTYVVEMLMI